MDGIRFHSKAEARRYSELRLLERAGEITGLKLQERFDMIIEGVLICRYHADFSYSDRSGQRIVEDVKGVLTAEFRLKSKLMKALHKIEIQLIRASR